MSFIGAISSNTTINKRLMETFTAERQKQHNLQLVDTDASVMELLNYDLPEIIIINFSDKNINLDSLVGQIRQDAWLHNFGILGLYDKNIHDEHRLFKQLKDINILGLLDYSKIGNQLWKNIDIIEANRQIIYQWELGNKLVETMSGSFTINNNPLSAPVYASLAAITLAQRGYINNEKRVNLTLAISELILNGIEHGNCKISFEEKSNYLKDGLSIAELVAEKCKNPEIRDKKIYLEWVNYPDYTQFNIRDEGDGFNVKKMKKQLQENDPFALHGRGVIMARSFSSKLTYNSKGNEARLVVTHDHNVTRSTPQGFQAEKAIYPEKGDIIFREGEASNYLYYISSGTYSVFHVGKKVATLTPADLFVGEMSFLLSNRRSATVRAEKKGKLIKISRKAFVTAIKEYPHYGIFLSKLLARKLQRANSTTVRSTAVRSSNQQEAENRPENADSADSNQAALN